MAKMTSELILTIWRSFLNGTHDCENVECGSSMTDSMSPVVATIIAILRHEIQTTRITHYLTTECATNYNVQ